MKKLFIPFVLSALAGMLLSSCSNSSKLSLTKRHYRSGYCIDFSRRSHTAVASIPTKTKHQIAPIAVTKSENYVTANATIITPGNSGTIQKTMTPKKEQETYPANIAANSNKQVVAQTFTESPIVENSQTLSGVSASSDNGDGAGAALSLLWIVIVVVLILWLLGIVVGIGPFVNILLIIALILLILWLFRLI